MMSDSDVCPDGCHPDEIGLTCVHDGAGRRQLQEDCVYNCCKSSSMDYCDKDKCTSPDGTGTGTDCCASMSWDEPQTCEEGYTVVPSPEKPGWCGFQDHDSDIDGGDTGGMVAALIWIIVIITFRVAVRLARCH